MSFIYRVLLLLITFNLNCFGQVPEFLKRWEDSPEQASQELPLKRGNLSPSKFLQADIASREFVEYKDKARMKLCSMANKVECRQDLQPLEAVDDFAIVRQFVGDNIETNIARLDVYKRGAARITPWSGHYWPIYDGGIATRYGDDQFPHSESFSVNYRYFRKNFLQDPRVVSNLNLLSPAEKYDLLGEDVNWTLTRSAWALGKNYYDKYRKVEAWMGICHGWAAASFLVPEPKKSFEVRLPALNKNVTIYADDVKAIVSQLWAHADVPSLLIGGRCNDKHPRRDSSGRLTSRDCFDANPASWHLSLINLMGRASKSFVFDATYDYEVWNQPLASYKFKYFNPNSKVLTDNLGAAVIDYASFRNDPYRRYRSVNTKSIVGVQLDLTYVVENTPGQVNGVDSNLPRLVSVTYYYDLEIDLNNNIIGGEWYQNAHPDILWKPTINRPLAKFEPQGSYWNGGFPVPMDLLLMSRKNSLYGQPISAIVDQLVGWSAL